VLRALAFVALALLVPAAEAGEHTPRSYSFGLPWAGELVNGVQLPAEGANFFTWDPVRRDSPNRPDRRWGNERLVRTVRHVLLRYARAHPDAPRVGVGDLSRPSGGPFGPKHASHQNGLDVDIYYPRGDRRERAPRRVGQVDRRLAQDLVDRFVRAGAQKVFVGSNVKLVGPRPVVQVIPMHDDHLHVRIAPDRHVETLGRSMLGRPIRAWRIGNPAAELKLLVVGCIHGTECAGTAVARLLLAGAAPSRAQVWVVSNLNPDGLRLGIRQNGRGVDLNRNFPSEWRPLGRRWDPQYPGPRALSERETRIAYRLIQRLRPAITVWYHQPQRVVRAWGPSIATARRYARLARMRYRSIRWPHGTAPNWQNHRFPSSSAFVVELASGSLSRAKADRHAQAILALAGTQR
jgi:hypothetical protein